MIGPHRTRDRSQRGSVSLELAVLGPALLVFLGVVIFAGRVAVAGQAVEQAAAEAARTASIARTQPEASAAATAAARDTLSLQDLDCTGIDVSVDTTGFGAPAGTPSTVTATVACPVRLADLAVPGLPGHRTLTASSTSALDTYREKADGFTNSDAVFGANSGVAP
jgi:Flp pilus assembly protein TadG